MRYYGIVDGEAGGYGLSFPDLPGCVAMGATVDEAINAGAEALRDWAVVMEANGRQIPSSRTPADLARDEEVAEALASGGMVVLVPLIREAGSKVAANLSLDRGILAAIDEAAGGMKVNRSRVVEILAERYLPELA